MGKGENGNGLLGKTYTWNDVKEHNSKQDLWIVINDNVYDLTQFQKKHPGGNRVINFYGGRDATEVFSAFHKDEQKLTKYLKVYHVGKLISSVEQEEKYDLLKRREDMKYDFENLRKLAVEMDLFKPSITFYTIHLTHILFFNILAYYLVLSYEPSMLTFMAALICHIIVQGQTAWNQHDYGHLSVFKNPKVNRISHVLMMGLIKGGSSHWWTHMHNQHHAKPNVIGQDPDVRVDKVFVLGEVLPKRTAEKNFKDKRTMLFPYIHQDKYFILLAPMLFPFYFQFKTIQHAYTRRFYGELASMLVFYVTFFSINSYAFGLLSAMSMFLLVRLVESTWFVWVAQSNHVVMDVHDDSEADSWLSLQLKATCNIQKSFFNDWFTGHLNFQIEHHLFPTMPRHNLYRVKPYVESLCKKHGINYITKTLTGAFGDILFSLKKSGNLWQEAYEELTSTS